jgi:putative DNA primase/helicase
MVLELAKATALSIYSEVAEARGEEERKAIARWAMASESQARLDALLYLARSLLPAEPGDFDADPWLVNLDNGTVDLRTGEIRNPSREDMITMLAPVVYDPEAQDDGFDRFLNDVTGGDAEFAAYLQRAVGYSLTGDTREEVLFLLLGPTATGKSTFLESIAEMLGDYALKLPIDTFLQRRDAGAARPDIARLRGARFVIALEAGKGRHLDEPAVKQIVGGDSISARFLYHDLITFRPMCKLWLGTNFAPEMNNLDSAIWRRVRRIPFERGFGEKLDPKVKLYLQHNPQARSTMLAWAVRGHLDWQQDGLGHAAIVDAKTAELRADMNPIREFIDACCVLGRGYVADAKGLRTAYEMWAKDNGARPIANKDWGEQLRNLGCESRRPTDSEGKQKTMWYGIGIQAEGE